MGFEQYLSAGMHIGMKQQTKDMKRFVYKVRDDGLAVLDLQTIESRIKTAANFLSKYKKVMVVSRKSIAKKAIEKFAEATGSKAICGRFLPGTITNPSFRGYYGPDVLLITDPSVDKQAMIEAVKMRIPIVSLADTFNETGFLDYIIPVNNKGRKSLSTTYFLLALELIKSRGEISEDSEFKYKVDDFESKDQRETRKHKSPMMRRPRMQRR